MLSTRPHNLRLVSTIRLEVPQRAEQKAKHYPVPHPCLPLTYGYTQRMSSLDSQAVPQHLLPQQANLVAGIPTPRRMCYHSIGATTHPLSSYSSPYIFDPTAMHFDNKYKHSSPSLEEWIHQITTVHNHIQNVLKRINHKLRTLNIKKARDFKIDYQVLVNRRNLQVQAGNNQFLTCKQIELQKVVKATGYHAYRLEVPKGMKWHNIVHATCFNPLRRHNEPLDIDKCKNKIWEV